MANGVDPSEKRKADKVEIKGLLTFEKVARDWHSSNRTWSESHRTTVLSSLESHLFPIIDNRNITELKTRDLLIPLKRAEATGHLELASRLQQRITAIMRYAVHNALIEQNPAYDLAGAVISKKSIHRPALPLERLPELIKHIKAYNGKGITQIATQLTLLTFVGSSELRFARWLEVDFKNALWTIPAERQALAGVKYSARGAKMKSPSSGAFKQTSHKIVVTATCNQWWQRPHVTCSLVATVNPPLPKSRKLCRTILTIQTSKPDSGSVRTAKTCSRL